jgi:hypothetical protein
MAQFYNCVATIMTYQLQSLCLNSILDLTDFICDVGVRFSSINPLKQSYYKVTFDFLYKVKINMIYKYCTSVQVILNKYVFLVECLILLLDAERYTAVVKQMR